MRAEAGFLACLLVSGCAINLASERAAPTPEPELPALSGCLPLADRAAALTGRLSLVTLADHTPLALADSATVAGETHSVAFSGASSGCLTESTPLAAQPLIDTAALSQGASLAARPLAALTLGDTVLYFSAEHASGVGSEGFGVARWDANNQRFVALSLLWTADRPSYGSAAALVGDEVYVLGGLAARFLSADVYLARVPRAQLAEPSAYEYWQGGGNFGPDPDSARPLIAGGTAPSLAWNAEHQRWLMLYATPLSTAVTVRSGLGVSGPWSAPYALGACDLPASGTNAFCGELSLTPTLAADGQIAFTQGVASFARPATATDQDFWTRLVRVPWPSALP